MQIRAFFASAALAVPSGLGLAAAATLPSTVIVAAATAMFDSEAAAQRHCPRDVVLWLNTPTYVCRKEADAAGDRDTRNGQ